MSSSEPEEQQCVPKQKQRKAPKTASCKTGSTDTISSDDRLKEIKKKNCLRNPGTVVENGNRLKPELSRELFECPCCTKNFQKLIPNHKARGYHEDEKNSSNDEWFHKKSMPKGDKPEEQKSTVLKAHGYDENLDSDFDDKEERQKKIKSQNKKEGSMFKILTKKFLPNKRSREGDAKNDEHLKKNEKETMRGSSIFRIFSKRPNSNKHSYDGANISDPITETYLSPALVTDGKKPKKKKEISFQCLTKKMKRSKSNSNAHEKPASENESSGEEKAEINSKKNKIREGSFHRFTNKLGLTKSNSKVLEKSASENELSEEEKAKKKEKKREGSFHRFTNKLGLTKSNSKVVEKSPSENEISDEENSKIMTKKDNKREGSFHRLTNMLKRTNSGIIEKVKSKIKDKNKEKTKQNDESLSENEGNLKKKRGSSIFRFFSKPMQKSKSGGNKADDTLKNDKNGKDAKKRKRHKSSGSDYEESSSENEDKDQRKRKSKNRSKNKKKSRRKRSSDSSESSDLGESIDSFECCNCARSSSEEDVRKPIRNFRKKTKKRNRKKSGLRKSSDSTISSDYDERFDSYERNQCCCDEYSSGTEDEQNPKCSTEKVKNNNVRNVRKNIKKPKRNRSIGSNRCREEYKGAIKKKIKNARNELENLIENKRKASLGRSLKTRIKKDNTKKELKNTKKSNRKKSCVRKVMDDLEEYIMKDQTSLKKLKPKISFGGNDCTEYISEENKNKMRCGRSRSKLRP